MFIDTFYAEGASAVGNAVMSYATLVCTLLVIVFIAYSVFKSFEKSKPNVEYIILLAFLTAIATVGRLIGIAIPGFQFATFIIIMAGVVFGRETGLFVGMLTAIVSDIVMGIGYWLPYQMLAWGIIGYISGLLVKPMDNIAFRTIFGLLCGFLFGLLTNIVMFYFLAEINLTSIIGVYIASMPIDLLHGVCSAACLLLLYNWFKKTFTRAKKRFLN